MNGFSRKHEAIDLLVLYTLHKDEVWYGFLNDCLVKRDFRRLLATQYALGVGMDNLAKKKLNTEEMISFYFELLNSLEATMRKIHKELRKNPCDNPLNTKEHSVLATEEKRKSDIEFENILRKNRF